MDFNVNSIDSYIKDCFIKAHQKEHRDYSVLNYDYRWILIQDKGEKEKWHFIPIYSKCKYERVLREVNKNLKWNLPRKFHITFGKTDDLRYLLYEDQLDRNYTEFAFKASDRYNYVSLSIFDSYTDDIIENEKPPRTFKLQEVFEGTEKQYYAMKDWQQFKDLCEKAGVNLGRDYKIICGPNVKLL